MTAKHKMSNNDTNGNLKVDGEQSMRPGPYEEWQAGKER